MSKVKVSADANGNVIVASEKNPEYGYIRVESTNITFQNGWAQPKTRSALLRGKVEDLKVLGLKAGQELPGKIVIKETLEATNPNDPDQDMKKAGATGITCTVNDQPIYRSAFYTENLDDQDVLMEHDNKADIQAAQKATRVQTANLS